MTQFARSLLLGAALLAVPSTSFAACTTANLEGKWRYTSTWFGVECSDGEGNRDHTCPEEGDVTLEPGPTAVDCHLQISSSGVVTAEGCTGSETSDLADFVFFDQWEPQLTSTCKFTGCVEVRGGVLHCHRGQLSPDKMMVNGIVRSDGLDFGQSRAAFSLVRR
jgi:hypothetical protein